MTNDQDIGGIRQLVSVAMTLSGEKRDIFLERLFERLGAGDGLERLVGIAMEMPTNERDFLLDKILDRQIAIPDSVHSHAGGRQQTTVKKVARKGHPDSRSALPSKRELEKIRASVAKERSGKLYPRSTAVAKTSVGRLSEETKQRAADMLQAGDEQGVIATTSGAMRRIVMPGDKKIVECAAGENEGAQSGDGSQSSGRKKRKPGPRPGKKPAAAKGDKKGRKVSQKPKTGKNAKKIRTHPVRKK